MNPVELNSILDAAVNKAMSESGQAAQSPNPSIAPAHTPSSQASDTILSEEEEAELEALENEEATRQTKAAIAARRQHLDAMRMAKRLSAKHGEPGKDFIVLETSLGVNIAVRRPLDVEVDELEADNGSEGRDALEKYAAAITLEPSTPEVQALIAKHAAVGPTIVRVSMKMLDIARKDDAKK